MLGEIAGEQTEIGFLGKAFHLLNDFFQPLPALLILVVNVINDEEVEFIRPILAFREHRPGPEAGREKAARAKAEHLPAGEFRPVDHDGFPGFHENRIALPFHHNLCCANCTRIKSALPAEPGNLHSSGIARESVVSQLREAGCQPAAKATTSKAGWQPAPRNWQTEILLEIQRLLCRNRRVTIRATLLENKDFSQRENDHVSVLASRFPGAIRSG